MKTFPVASSSADPEPGPQDRTRTVRGRGAPSAAVWCWLVARCVFGSPGIDAAQEPSSEYAVRAAFLYQFGNFVQWPSPDTDGAFEICIMGTDPFESLLEQVVAEAPPIGGNPVMVLRILGSTDAGPCRILYISPSEDHRLAEILEDLSMSPVLTVGEGRRFLQRGGMIGFEVENQRVRFDINPAVAQEAGLGISSQLLGVARRIEGSGQNTP